MPIQAFDIQLNTPSSLQSIGPHPRLSPPNGLNQANSSPSPDNLCAMETQDVICLEILHSFCYKFNLMRGCSRSVEEGGVSSSG